MGDTRRKQGEVLFYKNYPDGDPSKFVFGYNMAGSKVTSVDIYFSYQLKYRDYVLITDHNKHKFEKYLYGAPHSTIS